MPNGQNVKLAETDANSDQYGVVNTAVSGNSFETTVDFFSTSLYLNTGSGRIGDYNLHDLLLLEDAEGEEPGETGPVYLHS